MVRLSTTLLKRSLGQTDERAKLEGELLSGMEVVKCNAWEVRLPFSPSATLVYPTTGNDGRPLADVGSPETRRCDL